ncbi:hypothetical protein [Oscillibacter sp.]|uniref:hypothetical protein n=1 Tax=Oscillibacter sp. TaxID=1945593 RepID=UPI00289712CD|nr:hypothetical protein [Oscillibacter sp.]
MLRKLIKHEFRATARVMGPLFLIILVLALTANLSLQFLLDASGFFPNLMGGLLLFAFGIGMAALVIISIVLMVERFRANLMGDEGYVMFTLPVSGHQLVWSKIIVSTVWFIATTVVEALAILVCAFDLDLLRDIFDSSLFGRTLEAIKALVVEYGLNLPMMAVEIIAVSLLACAVLCLEFYAAIAVGHSFANHKSAWSVLFFFAFQFVTQIVSGLFVNTDFFTGLFNTGGMNSFHQLMAVLICMELLNGGIFYAVTTVTLKKRLNLQ